MITELLNVCCGSWNRQAVFLYQSPPRFYFFAELEKCFLYCLTCSVYVQMIGIHGTDHRNIRVQPEKTPVVFVGFHYTYIIALAPEIRIVVGVNATKKCIGSQATVPQNMGDHRADGCFSMSACNADIPCISSD